MEDGGAECASRGDGSCVCSAGVFGDDGVVLVVPCFLRTIERYASAILGPEGVEDDRVAVVVFNSCSEERTNWTRLRRIPAPKIL